MGGSHADISKHVKVYILVFIALAVGTVITVGAARVDFGGHLNVIVALLIAVVKASLVAAIFMHLKWERSLWIWYSLGICAIFFVFLMAIPVLTNSDHPALTEHRMWDQLPPSTRTQHGDAGHGSGH